jgi:hypothetical protein
MAAVAIDLGTAYSSSRKSQNSADDAALAASRVLQCYEVVNNSTSPLYNPSAAGQYDCPTGASAYSASQVATTAAQVALDDNGADLVSCQVISYYGASPTPPYYLPLDSCSDSAWQSDPLADGVFVQTRTSEDTSFGKAVGTNQLTQLRQAAATVQQLTGVGNLNSIILVCAGFDPGTAQTDANTGGAIPPLVSYDPVAQQFKLNLTEATPPLSGNTYNGPVYNPNWTGSWGYGQPAMQLHGTHIDTCGLSSQGWKGIGNTSGSLPGWYSITTGDKAGPTRVAIAGQVGCTASDLSQDPTGCVMALPICTDSNALGGSNGQLYCVAWGAFELLASNSNSQVLGFVGTADVSSGQTGSGPPSSNNINVVQLVQ